MAGTAQETELSLKEICFYAVRQHFAALGADAVLGEWRLLFYEITFIVIEKMSLCCESILTLF